MSSESPTQLVLGMRLSDDATFSNFLIAPENQQLVSALQDSLAGGQLIYLWGAQGSGRSHLLQAICHAYSEAGAPVLYLPLAEKGGLAPEILQQSSSLSLVCLDDISQIGSDEQWQEAVFHSVNEMTESSNRFCSGEHNCAVSNSVIRSATLSCYDQTAACLH
jgi:DnaA family protein